MANEFRTLESHSAEYFGDTRDYWWNDDFLELIGKRLEFDRVSDVLDVGCGVGHWGRVLAKVLPGGVHVRGVDRDPLWVEKAELRAAALGFADRFGYEVAVAEKLPFADASFDLVTCQTLLIHAPDPGGVIDEMIRVARPGGLISRPNPIISRAPSRSIRSHSTIPLTKSSLALASSSSASAARPPSARAPTRSGSSSPGFSPHAASPTSAFI
jgi:ubiquinone/menaquinone biosynthesis C-methylase UbiE